jgi:hypothetical protein
MEKNSVYFVGFGLYIVVLIISIILFRKTDINNLKFLLYSGLALIIVNVIYLILVRIIFNNSYAGLLLVYAISILNLVSIPTILILFIIKLTKS